MKDKTRTLTKKLEDAQLDHYDCSKNGSRRCQYDRSLTCLEFASLTMRQKMDRKIRHLARRSE